MAEAQCEKCEEPFTDPRILPCLHTFCFKCLQKVTESTNEPLQCPTCDEKVPVPSAGIQAIPKDQRKAHDAEKARLNDKIESGEEKCDQCVRTDSGEAVAFCVQCSDFLCEACRDHHRAWRKTLDHEIIPTGERLSKGDEGSVVSKFCPQPVQCTIHRGESLKYYCKQCKQLICRDCMGSKVHKSHNEHCILVEEVAEEEMQSLESRLTSSNSAVPKLDGAINDCQKTTKQVKTRKDAVDRMINSSLERVRETLLTQNATLCKCKVGVLDKQEQELLRIRKGLAFANHLIEKSSEYTPDQQLSTKDVIASRVDKLLTQFKSKTLTPMEDNNFVTKVAEETIVAKMITLCRVSGGVHSASSTFDSTIPSRVFSGREYTMTITARDKERKAIWTSGQRVEVKIGPQFQGLIICRVVDNQDGTYTAHYSTQSGGQHELHATIAGSPIKYSPLRFPVKQSRSYTNLSSQESFYTSSCPWDVAINSNGDMFIAEYSYHSVTLRDKKSKNVIYTFGTGRAGAATNQFHSPGGVGVNGDTLYVADQGNNRIKTFSISRKEYLTTFGDASSQLSSPRGICFDLKGNVFVADCNNHRIQVFISDGNLKTSITGDREEAKQESLGNYI